MIVCTRSSKDSCKGPHNANTKKQRIPLKQVGDPLMDMTEVMWHILHTAYQMIGHLASFITVIHRAMIGLNVSLKIYFTEIKPLPAARSPQELALATQFPHIYQPKMTIKH